MDAQSAFQLPFHFHRSKPVVVEPTAGQVTSDAGLLPFRMFDEQIDLTRQLAEALEDRRHGSYIDHSFLEMTRMRRHVAELPSEPSGNEVPTEALSGRRRRRWHNRRREHDPLGEGHPCTWRTRLIKVGARIVETTRRIVVQLSSSWPYLDHYYQVSRQVLTSGRAASDTS